MPHVGNPDALDWRLIHLHLEQSLTIPDLRSRIMQSMLVSCGKFGYRNVTVATAYPCPSGTQAEFYKYFRGKEDCFAEAYEREIDRICDPILRPTEQVGEKRRSLKQGLLGLVEFVISEPLIARALFVEVHVAGGSLLDKRQEVMERLAGAVEEAYREQASEKPLEAPPPPPITGEFIVGAVEHAFYTAIAKRTPEELRSTVPELAAIAAEFHGCR